ncbi:MAG: hypothetical protein M5U27_12170 [Gaiella sp.]|nr:hypothetical protein [Gaiella sp.]
MTLVVVDADVLGRRRTGDETYVRNLLRTLPAPAEAAGLRIAAVTRHPELVPEGVLPVLLPARSQELRMAWTLPGHCAGSALRSSTRSTRCRSGARARPSSRSTTCPSSTG